MDCQWHANKISFLDSFCKKGTCGNIATSAFALLWPRSKQKMSVHNLNQLWTLDMVGVTGFEPAIALPSRIVAPTWQNQVASPRYTRLRPLLALWGKTSKKRPTGAFFLRFLLIPNRSLGTSKEAAGLNQTAAIEKEKDASCRKHPSLFGRSDWIWTSGLLVPNQALYRTEPHPEVFCFLLSQRMYYSTLRRFCQGVFSKKYNFFRRFPYIIRECRCKVRIYPKFPCRCGWQMICCLL